jgi:Family of unknown function (DUF5723)
MATDVLYTYCRIMQTNTFLRCCTMAKQIMFIICIQFIVSFCKGQSYTGYQSSAYAGVYSILNNPADILNHRVRGDLNLAGVFTGVGNNIVTFKYKNRKDDKGGISYPDPIKKKGKANFNADVFGPSLLIRLSDKNAVAISTRARVMANVYGVSPLILNSMLQDTINGFLINNNLSVNNMSFNAHAWKEVALTCSREIAHTDFGVWKAGVSVKYLGGVAAFSFGTNKLSFIHDSIFDSRAGANKDAVINAQGSIFINYTKNLDSLSDNANDYLSFKNRGFGIDVGVNYEYREEMQVYETAYSDKTNNYIWKIGAAITDIGAIRYSRQQTKGIVAKASGNTYTIDELKPPSDSNDIYQMANYYNNLFKTRTESSALTMQLPATLHLSYDRYFNTVLGIQAQVNIPLVFSRLNLYNGNYNPVSVVITPRAEISWAGLSVPLSYNSISGFTMGACMRLGPLVIGSASIINARIFGKTKAADAYFILRLPFFGYRQYINSIFKPAKPKLTKLQRRQLNCPVN